MSIFSIFLHDIINTPAIGRVVGDIKNVGPRSSALCGRDGLTDLFYVGVEVDASNGRPFSRKFANDRRPDALRRTRNRGDPPLKLHAVLLILAQNVLN